MDDEYECPHCSHKGSENSFLTDSDAAEAAGVLQCPACEELIWGDE